MVFISGINYILVLQKFQYELYLFKSKRKPFINKLLLVNLHHKRTLIWRPPSLSELTSIIVNIGLTHLGLDAPIYS